MFRNTEPDLHEQLMQFLGDVAHRQTKLADFITTLDSPEPAKIAELAKSLRTISRRLTTIRDQESTLPLYEAEDPYDL